MPMDIPSLGIQNIQEISNGHSVKVKLAKGDAATFMLKFANVWLFDGLLKE